MKVSDKGYVIILGVVLALLFLPDLLADIGLNISEYVLMFLILFVTSILFNDSILEEK